MAKNKLIQDIILEIINEADSIIKEKIDDKLTIDYVDIFPHSEKEREQLTEEIKKLGKVVFEIDTGKTYQLINPITTKFGPLYLARIRIVDRSRPQRGAPDFKVKNYSNFKNKHSNDKSFRLIIRKDYEMIELKKEGKNVLIYFPNKTLSESLGL